MQFVVEAQVAAGLAADMVADFRFLSRTSFQTQRLFWPLDNKKPASISKCGLCKADGHLRNGLAKQTNVRGHPLSPVNAMADPAL